MGRRRRVSDLVVVADEDVNGRKEQLKHRLFVALLHLETQPIQEARRALGTVAAAVLESWREKRDGVRDALLDGAFFPKKRGRDEKKKNTTQPS